MDLIYRLKVNPTVRGVRITQENIEWVTGWCKGVRLPDRFGIRVPTLSGAKEAYEGDYVYKTRSGDFKVSDAIPFEIKYELMD